MRKLKTLCSHTNAEERISGSLGMAQDGRGNENQETSRYNNLVVNSSYTAVQKRGQLNPRILTTLAQT